MNTCEMYEKAHQLRNSVLDMCVNAGTGHINSSYSCVELLVALYYGGVMRFDAMNPKWENRDRFILSKGHASAILYPILADLGFFSKDELDRLGKAEGRLGVHLQYDIPGVEVTTGSLGNGFGIAAGMALAAKMNRDLYMTFALLGDGECYEGSIWETAMFAAQHRLNNLVAIIDRNHLCVTDFTENFLALEPLGEKWSQFGWNVKTIDGHSIEQILEVLQDVRSLKNNKPLLIVADTTKGKGIDTMCNDPLWHGRVPKGDSAVLAKKELNGQ